VGLPVSTTRFADTEVSTGSAVSTGVDSERPAPNRFLIPRERMFHAAFASLSASNPHAGHECSRIHNGFSVETPQDAHSFVVPRGFTATKCVPSRSHLYSSIRRNVPTPHLRGSVSCPVARPIPLRPNLLLPRGRIRGRSSSRVCEESHGACASTRRGVRPQLGAVSPNSLTPAVSARGCVGRVPTVRARRTGREIRRRFRPCRART